MAELMVYLFKILLIIALWLGFFLLIRKLVLWYWKVNKAIHALEDMYELQLLLHAKEIKETRIAFKNKSTQKVVEMSIAEYLQKENKHHYKIQ